MSSLNVVYVTFAKKNNITNEVLIQRLLKKVGLPMELIQKESSGRPYLPMARHLGWDISLSHSESYQAVVLGYQVKVGIDCEDLKKIDLNESFLKLVLSPEEHLIWNISDYGIDRFYEVWTCKEAVSKAIGLGLWLPFNLLQLDSPTESLRKLSLLTQYQQLCCEVLPFSTSDSKVSLATILKIGTSCNVVTCHN